MNFLADESIDWPIVERLRNENYHVEYVVEIGPGISDERVLEIANLTRAILLTSDKDFGEIVFYQKRVTQGVVLIRLAGMSPASKGAVVAEALKDHASELIQAFTVIVPGAIRIRRRII
jgi:predicted nuclease of predicted toxin-antitoxin system